MGRLFASGGQGIGSFSLSLSPSNEYSGLISFRMDWLDLPAVQGPEDSPSFLLFSFLPGGCCSVVSLAAGIFLSLRDSQQSCWERPVALERPSA